MDKEKLKVSPLVTEIREYITREYGTMENAVSMVLAEAATFSGDPDIQAARLKQRAVLTAGELGLISVVNPKYPGYHTPTIIEAARRIEKDVPEEKKRIPLPLEVKILALSEYTNAGHFAKEGYFDQAAYSAARGMRLSAFNHRLKRSREFSWFFTKIRE